MSISESGQYDLLDQLAEEFAARVRRGERPSLEEYADRYPELADEIRGLFPAMVQVEQAGGVRQGGEDTEEFRSANSLLRQLGDYRIVRQIGRGGMGVVYEAEQISLGRRVALKVLPGQVSRDRVVLERFRREARAAARLHHTNIVPVYEVGRDGDVAFYTMQFIQGQGLDQVIDELARLRARDREPVRNDHAGSGGAVKPTITIQNVGAAASGPQDRKVGQVAESLLGGRLGTGRLVSSAAAASATTEDAGTGPSDFGATTDPESRDSGRYSTGTPPAADVSGSAVLPGGSAVSAVESSSRRTPYFRSVAQIGRQVTQGLAHAHARGVVHRDIKPSNLLLDTAGVVWITDFGLAKAEEDGLTATGDILGTLRYMAPERFRGEGDSRADIYALGLTLYELLTLRPAFETSDRLKLIERIKTEDPARPRSLDVRIPRDLETIVLKASDKDPARRYATAEAMAEDLRRFLADEPIQARRISGAEWAWRWCRRNPGLASVSALFILALVATAAIALAFAAYQARNAHQQTLAAGRELGLRKNSEVLLARVALKEGVSRCEQSDVGHGLLWLARALEFAPADQPDLQREIRLNIDRWSRSAPHLRYTREFSKSVNAVAISPDGTRALAGSADGTAQLWELASGRPIAPAMRHGGSVLAVAFSPDGTLAVTASADSRARLWKSDTGQEVSPALDHGGPIECVDFSPDGRHLATAGTNRCARLWDLSNGHSIALSRGPDAPEPPGEIIRWYVRFAPDGKRLITTRSDWSHGRHAISQLWAVPTGAPIGPEMNHDSVFIWAMTFDPEGERVLAAGNDGTAWLWEVATGTRKVGPFRHLDAVSAAAFGPDGRSFATGCGDGTICVWDPVILDKRSSTFLHPQRCTIVGVAFRDDGRWLLSAGGDGVARLWDPVGGRPLGGPCLHREPLKCAAMDPRGRWILTGGEDGVARVWEAPTSVSLLPAMSRANWGIRALAFSPDGSTILTGNDVGDVMLWDAAGAVEIRPPLMSPGAILSVAFSPDGHVFATAGQKQPLRIFDRQTGRLIHKLGDPADLTGLAFRPDGTLLAGGEDGKARLWDLGPRRPIGPDLVHGGAIRAVAISPDGRLAVTAGDDGRVLIWSLGTNQPVSALEHPARVRDVAFAATDASLLTGCDDGKVRLWDVGSRRLLHEFVLGTPVNAVAASPDGRTLAAGGSDRTVSLWDAADGQLLDRKSERQSGFVHDLAYRPDGQAIAIGLGDGTTGLADVAYPVEGGIDELGLWSQVTTNSRLDDEGNLVRLDHRAWSEARRALAALQSRSPPTR
jgi:WD40 repeat protein/serine/threonine protein kinase